MAYNHLSSSQERRTNGRARNCVGIHSFDELIERISALKTQEEGYRCPDYLGKTKRSKSCSQDQTSKQANPTYNIETSDIADLTSAEWREEMCEWSYTVIDHCDIDREAVAISFSFLDRFLAKMQCNRKQFKLAAMTALYLAVKLFSRKRIKAQSLAELSCGHFTAGNIEAMELIILDVLSWRTHPPTPVTFVYHIFLLLPPLTPQAESAIQDISTYLVELSVCDYWFVTYKSSCVALASVVTAMSLLESSLGSSLNFHSEFQTRMSRVGLFEGDTIEKDIKDASARLKKMYLQSMECIQKIEVNTANTSPVSSASPGNVLNMTAAAFQEAHSFQPQAFSAAHRSTVCAKRAPKKSVTQTKSDTP